MEGDVKKINSNNNESKRSQSKYKLFLAVAYLLIVALAFHTRYEIAGYLTNISADSYARQLGTIYDLNIYFVGAACALVCVPLFIIFVKLLSFNHHEQLKGYVYACLLSAVMMIALGVGATLYPRIQDKCFVLTNKGVDYYELNGKLPSAIITRTNQPCREIKPEFLLSLAAYEKGEQLAKIDPISDFDLFDRSSLPKVWYSKKTDGEFILYNMMGYDLLSNEELLPVNREVADLIRLQRDEKKQKQAEIEEERQFELLAAQAEQDAAIHRENQQHERNMRSAKECDRLAGDSIDIRANKDYSGVSIDRVRMNGMAALEHCGIAASSFSNIHRYKYQLARAIGATNRGDALSIFEELVEVKYPAAYSSVGAIIYHQGQPSRDRAVQLFSNGSELGDPESSYRLGLMYYYGEYYKKDIRQAVILLNKAAQAGHFEAERRFADVSRETENSKLVGDLLKIGLIVGLSALKKRDEN
jgi:TPR repeat protein